MAARLIQIEGSAPWQARCNGCPWRSDPFGSKADADRAASRHRFAEHRRAAVDAERQRRHRLNAAAPC
jgi:hypothetical protein